jgi:hypothetical protein
MLHGTDITATSPNPAASAGLPAVAALRAYWPFPFPLPWPFL